MRVTRAPRYTLLQLEEYRRLLKEEDEVGFYNFCQGLEMEVHIALFNSFEKGQKTKNKQKARNLMKRGYEEHHSQHFQKERNMSEKRLNGRRCQCAACDQYFNSEAAFTKHRVWVHKINNNVCLTVAQMSDRDMVSNKDGFWITEAWKERNSEL